MTKVIIFDLDDTLIEDDDATQRALAVVGEYARERFGVEAGRLAEDAYRRACELWHAGPVFPYCDFMGISASEGLWGRFVDPTGRDSQLRALQRWVPAYRLEAWSRALADQGVHDKEPGQKLVELFIEARHSYSVFEEVEPVLEDLGKDYRLAMLTNGASDLQREKVEQTGLGRYFELIVVSGEFGAGKPDKEVFAHVLERLEVGPEESVMVGDSLPRDIVGAQRSGMRGIWINRQRRACSEQYAPLVHAHITDLRELRSVL